MNVYDKIDEEFGKTQSLRLTDDASSAISAYMLMEQTRTGVKPSINTAINALLVIGHKSQLKAKPRRAKSGGEGTVTK